MSKERGFVIIGTVNGRGGATIVVEMLVIATSLEEAITNCGLQGAVVTKTFENVNIVGGWRF